MLGQSSGSCTFYDSNELADRLHLDVAKGLRLAVLEQLQRMLHRCNPFVQLFKTINMAEFGPNVNLVLQADVGMLYLNFIQSHGSSLFAYLTSSQHNYHAYMLYDMYIFMVGVYHLACLLK